jgi:flagellar motor switch protein FliG
LKKLNGKEKAMVFLAALGDQAASNVLKLLPEKIAKKITEELDFYPKPDNESIGLVFKELNKLALKPGKEEESRMALEIEKQLDQEKEEAIQKELHSFDMIDADKLQKVLQNEKPQTIAFILSYMAEGPRETLEKFLPFGKKQDVAKLAVKDFPLKKNIEQKLEDLLLAL